MASCGVNGKPQTRVPSRLAASRPVRHSPKGDGGRRAGAVGGRRVGSGTLLGANMFWAESVGTPDARTIYYNYGAAGGTSDVLRRFANPPADRGRRRKSSMSPFSPHRWV